MLNKENVKNSFYDCLVCSKTNRAVSVSVITDKQQLNCFSLSNDESHDSISEKINSAINPNSDPFEGNDNVYVALAGKNIFIDLASSNHFSLSQYKFMLNLLDEIEQFINENDNYKNMNIMLMSPKICGEYLKISEIKEMLKTLITKDISITSEIILGKTLDKEDVVDSIKYSLDFCNNLTINNLCNIMIKCNNYKKDTYYKQFIEDIIPDLKEIDLLIDLYYACGYGNLVIENINYSNIKENLCISLVKLYTNASLERLYLIDEYIFKSNIENIDMYLPNYVYFNYLIKSIDRNSNEYLNQELIKCNSYKEVVEVIVKYSYHLEINKRNKYEKLLNSSIDRLNRIHKHNNLVNNKEKVIELIGSIHKLDILVFEKEILIDNMDYHINQGKENSTNIDSYMKQKEELILEVKKIKEKIAVVKKELNDKYGIDDILYNEDYIKNLEIISLNETNDEIEFLKLEIKKSKDIINYIVNNFSFSESINNYESSDRLRRL